MNVMVLGKPFRCRAITAADVANMLSGPQGQCGGQMGDKNLDSFVRSFPACPPEPVMDVLAPDLPIEWIELIVMLCDGGG